MWNLVMQRNNEFIFTSEVEYRRIFFLLAKQLIVNQEYDLQ